MPGATSPGIRTRTPPPGRPADIAGRPSSNRKTATLTPPGTARFPTADTRTTRGETPQPTVRSAPSTHTLKLRNHTADGTRQRRPAFLSDPHDTMPDTPGMRQTTDMYGTPAPACHACRRRSQATRRKPRETTPPAPAGQADPALIPQTTPGMNANRSPAPPAGRRGKDNPRHPILTADPCAPTAPAQPHDAPSAPPHHPHGSTPSGPATPVHHPRDRHPYGHRNTPPAESRLRRASPARSSLPPDFLRFSNPTSLVSGFYAYFIHLPTR